MTDKFQYSLKFCVLTDVSVVHLSDLTKGHQHNPHSRSMHSLWSASPMDTYQLYVSCILAASEDFPTVTCKFFKQLLCTVLIVFRRLHRKRMAWVERNMPKINWEELVEATLIFDKKVSYYKQIACQHSFRWNGEHAQWQWVTEMLGLLTHRR